MNIFNEEGLPLDRVLFGHADDGFNAPTPRTIGSPSRAAASASTPSATRLELADPPFWGRKRAERMEHFINFVNKGYADKLLVSADANCSPLGWPGVKGHTINYIFEDMIPDMRAAGLDDATNKICSRTTRPNS